MLPRAAKKRQIPRVLALFLCLLAGACSRGEQAASPAGDGDLACTADPASLRSAHIASVIDGDTLRLDDGRRVRLIGINTPELGHGRRPDEPLGQQARTALAQLLAGDTAWLADGVDDRDPHGRLLAWVFDASGHSVSAQLLERGLGFHVAIAPNGGRADCLRAAENVARRDRRGVWSDPAYAVRSAAQLAPGFRGFALVRDRVTHVSFKDNGWWIQLGGKIGVHIKPEDTGLYSRNAVTGLDGHTVQVRGWLVPMNGGWWVLTLGHPAMLEAPPDTRLW